MTLGLSRAFGIGEDERRIDQLCAVIEHQRRRLHHGIDRGEGAEFAEHRQGLEREGQAHHR
jgi:hypothetical protein